MTNEEVARITTWAVEIADEYNIAITTVVKMFQMFHSSGLSVNQAKNEVEKRYSSYEVIS